MRQAVICIVPTESQASRIIEALRDEGFLPGDISILYPDTTGVRDLGVEKHSKAPEGTATGAGTGALVGGALGWLAGIGAIVIPGVGPFIAAGPIMAALAGVAVGASTGGVVGGLIGLGIPEMEAKQYEGKLREGNILLSVHTEDRDEAKRAEEVLKEAGAEQVNTVAEEKVRRA
jgi:hypothetical protein